MTAPAGDTMTGPMRAPTHAGVARSLREAPIIGVVRCATRAEGARQARALIAGGLELIEITWTVPEAPDLVRELRAERSGEGPPWIGMGTVTSAERAAGAIAAGAQFIVTPSATGEVAAAARAAGLFLVLGALTPTEIVAAQGLGADLVKVYPLPPVGGAAYLATVRQPLGDVPMLAAGGFGVEEIPLYRAAGAVAFGMGAPLLGCTEGEGGRRIPRALLLARGEEAP
jgi:2-dehydro-3-deoxyphosphogluconate aldolase/(4S)-4-hydroxy-2-oxoglutarate aldolase